MKIEGKSEFAGCTHVHCICTLKQFPRWDSGTPETSPGAARGRAEMFRDGFCGAGQSRCAVTAGFWGVATLPHGQLETARTQHGGALQVCP